jgi:hypothetical protein
MAQYFSQSQWRPHTLTGEGVQPVQGLIDGEGNFRFGNLSRGGAVQAKLSIEPSNRDFFRYCREGSAGMLGAMRRSKEGHAYKLSARFLPSFRGFANSPFETLNWRPLKNAIAVNFFAGAVADGYTDKPRTNFVKELNRQIAAQKEFGAIELDLSGWDDMVCDLVQGRISLTYAGQGISDAPAIAQRKQVEPNDVRAAYLALKDQMPAANAKEANLFLAGRVLARLEQERRIGAWGDQKSFEVFRKLASADLSRLNELDESGIQCAADQLQTYAREIENNHFNVKLSAGSLDDLEAAALGKK